MEGINVSFGIGAFPFTMLGGVSLWSNSHQSIFTLFPLSLCSQPLVEINLVSSLLVVLCHS